VPSSKVAERAAIALRVPCISWGRTEQSGGSVARRPGSALPKSAGGRLTGEDRQLSGESPLVGGRRFAARDLGGKARMLLQYSRPVQPS
jgi:hypothetical protein